MLWHTDRRWCCRLCFCCRRADCCSTQSSTCCTVKPLYCIAARITFLVFWKQFMAELKTMKKKEKRKKVTTTGGLAKNAGGHIKCYSEPQTMSECHVGRLQFWFQNMFLQSTRHRCTQKDLWCVFNSTSSRFYPFLCRTALQWDPSWDFLHFPSRPFSQEPHQTFLNNATGKTNQSGWWGGGSGHGDLISHFIS